MGGAFESENSCGDTGSQVDSSGNKRARMSPSHFTESLMVKSDDDGEGDGDRRRRKQGRLETVIHQLKNLASEQEQFKMRLHEARQEQNLDATKQLEAELDQIAALQTWLINEQCQINRHLMSERLQAAANHHHQRMSMSEGEKADSDDDTGKSCF